MTNYEVRLLALPADQAEGGIEAWLEAAFISQGLTCTLKGTLGKYPGSVHWHWKQGRQPGTLEATWWPRQDRCWLTIQAGRSANWTEDMAQTLLRQLEEAPMQTASKSAAEA